MRSAAANRAGSIMTPLLPGLLPDGPVPSGLEELVATPLLSGPGMRTNFVWMLAGTLWSGVCQWALLVALAKLGSVSMVGAFTLAMAIAVPVLMFSCLNLRSLYVTDGQYSYRFLEYVALRVLMATASVGFAFGLAIYAGYSRDLVKSISLITLAKAIEYISDILYGVLQRQERMAAISLSMVIRGTLSLVLLTVAIQTRGSLVWGAAGLVVSSAAVLLFFDIPVCFSTLRVDTKYAMHECNAFSKSLFGFGRPGYRRLRRLALAGAPRRGLRR